MRWAIKNYPLPFHQFALEAAEAYEEAKAQGKAFEMKDMLFDHQQALDESSLVGYAKKLGLNVDQFKEALKDHRHQKAIKADIEQGNQVGVNSTPSFYINGVPFVGAQPYEAFKGAIDSELAQK